MRRFDRFAEATNSRVERKAEWPGRRALTDRLPFVTKRAKLVAKAAAGTPMALPDPISNVLSTALGVPLEGVRIHTSTEAARAAAAVESRACTVGQNIYFAEGEYDPDSERGRELIAHEVAHTVQQLGAQQGRKLTTSRSSDSHEVEAALFARSLLLGRPQSVQPVIPGSMSQAVIARDDDGGDYGGGDYGGGDYGSDDSGGGDTSAEESDSANESAEAEPEATEEGEAEPEERDTSEAEPEEKESESEAEDKAASEGEAESKDSDKVGSPGEKDSEKSAEGDEAEDKEAESKPEEAKEGGEPADPEAKPEEGKTDPEAKPEEGKTDPEAKPEEGKTDEAKTEPDTKAPESIEDKERRMAEIAERQSRNEMTPEDAKWLQENRSDKPFQQVTAGVRTTTPSAQGKVVDYSRGTAQYNTEKGFSTEGETGKVAQRGMVTDRRGFKSDGTPVDKSEATVWRRGPAELKAGYDRVSQHPYVQGSVRMGNSEAFVKVEPNNLTPEERLGREAAARVDAYDSGREMDWYARAIEAYRNGQPIPPRPSR